MGSRDVCESAAKASAILPGPHPLVLASRDPGVGWSGLGARGSKDATRAGRSPCTAIGGWFEARAPERQFRRRIWHGARGLGELQRHWEVCRYGHVIPIDSAELR